MEQDYDKIFASNASSSQEWEDENYLKGWGFLGQTPPPYQLFDSLFKRLDLKTKELYDEQKKSDKKYVPLTGGTMTGLLKLFTGSTVTTPSTSDNSTKIANTEWVQDYVTSALETLNAENVGNVIYRPFLQEGYVKLNGATVQREDYPRLVQYATDNSLFTADNSNTPWLFGNGDGETTFVLPDYRNVFIEGGDTPSKIEAGLPNITGTLDAYTGYSNASIGIRNVTGAFSYQGSGTIISRAETAGGTRGVNLDASLSNSIYGNAETVQPPAITLIPQIKY